MKRHVTKKKGSGGEGKNPAMHNAVAHHPLTDARTAIRPSWPTPPCLYTGHDIYMIYTYTAVSFLHTCLLAEHGRLKRPWLKLSAT